MPPKKPTSLMTIKTEDGYTFHLLPNGTVVDNLDPDGVDMSWPTFDDFVLNADFTFSIVGPGYSIDCDPEDYIQ